MSSSASLACPSCSGAFSIHLQLNADIEDDSSLNVALGAKSNGPSSGVPSLKELQHGESMLQLNYTIPYSTDSSYLEDIGLGCRALHGGMNVKASDDCLREFREDNDVRVLLMSLKAGGVALNLTCANQIFLMDPWWNPAAEMQAIDRTHRLGQYRPIRAVRFIAENTVEERILQLQEKKRLVFDGTVGRSRMHQLNKSYYCQTQQGCRKLEDVDSG
ncbi:hypothetical protein ACHAXH_001556 [Discostella pseudostelligera]